MQISEEVAMDNGQITIEEMWKTMKPAMTTSVREVLATQKHRRRETWYDNECARIIGERNRLHKRYIQRRTRNRREDFEHARRSADRNMQKKQKTVHESTNNSDRERF